MGNITRFDPFSVELDDFFKGMFLRPVRVDIATPEVQIKLNVTRGDVPEPATVALLALGLVGLGFSRRLNG